MANLPQYDWNDLFHIETDHVNYHIKNSFHNAMYNELPASNPGEINMQTDTPFVTFPSLDRVNFVRHGFSTRLGGVSKEEFATMNLSFSRGDNEEAVVENYRRILTSLAMEQNHLVFSDQVHDTIIHKVTASDYTTLEKHDKKLEGIDGLITNEPNVTLITSYADCVPLYFVDTKNRAIGLSHSGWKGTVGKIGKKTVEAMTTHYHSKPADIVAVIGPSICSDCYEVGEEVAEAFRLNFSADQIDKILYKKDQTKYQLDLWLANRYILLEAGLLPENISISCLCTCHNSGLFFSHRKSGGRRGNLAAFLSIKE